jgi:SAM-dependent methyltransferase
MVMVLNPTSGFQFERTRPLRVWVYREARLASRRSVLEVGAGEGVVASEMAVRTGRTVLALDRVPGPRRPGVAAVTGDAVRLPFRDSRFDAVAFHFVLLWLPDPVAALRETWRVLAPGGVVMILAEPDSFRRREEPEIGVGTLMTAALRAAGGHPDAGSRLAGWMREAGFAPHLRESPPKPVGITDPAELLHEADFLKGEGIETGPLRARIRCALGEGGGLRVTLPLRYGWGTRAPGPPSGVGVNRFPP